MKQKIQKFPQFLADRFQPCILCSFSDEVSKIVPDIMDKISSAWDQVNIENNSKVRMIFPKCKVDINLAISEIINMRYTQPDTEPYFFLNKEPILEEQNELLTMTILRQRLFESDFMPYYLYCDIPISILLFTVKNEKPFPSKSYFPDWISSTISSIRPDIIKLPIDDFKSCLRDYFNKKYIPSLMKSEQYVVHDRQSVKKDNYFSIRNEPSSKMIAVKYFADLKMQQKQYAEAITEYKRLFETPLGQQCRFLVILCSIMKGDKKLIDVNAIDQALPDNNLIEKFAIHMTKLYIERSIPIMKQILPFGKFFIVLNPFLFEQYAYLLSIRKRSFMLYYASRGFSSINSPESEVRCLYNSWGIVHPHNFNLVAQTLIEKALEKYLGEHVSRLIELSLSCREIDHPQIIQQKLSLIFDEKRKKEKKRNLIAKSEQTDKPENQPNKNKDVNAPPLIFVPPESFPYRNLGDMPIHCGFVDSRIIKLEPNGFPCAPPENFCGYWPKAAQQMFGSFDRKRFFSSNIFNIIECATDEVITIQVFFYNRCPSFALTNARLRSSGTAQVEIFPELPGEENSHFLNAKFIARTKGTLEISGMEFEYLSGPSNNSQQNEEFVPYEERGVVKFVKIFPGSSLSFTVYDKCPRISLYVEGGKDDIFVDEIVPLTIKIKNGPIKLKYLALMAVGNAYYNVLSPQTEELSGQRFIKALEPFEEFVVRVAVCGKVVGLNQLMLLFPFWSFEPPCRYNYCNFTFNVHHAPEIPLFMQNEEVVGQCPNGYKAFGFTANSFDARLFITKLEGRNCHMSLIRSLNPPTKIMFNKNNSYYTILNNNENSNENDKDNNINDSENNIENDSKNKVEDESIKVLNVQNPEFYYELPDFCQSFIEDKKGILFWYKTDKSYVFASLDLNDAYVSLIIENVEENQDQYDLFKLTLKNISKKKIKDTRVSFVEMQDDISYLYSGISVKSIGVLEVGQSYEYYFRMKLLFNEASPIVMISGENFAIVHPIVIRRSHNRLINV